MHVCATEVRWSAQNAGVSEVNHGIKLLQIVLHGCTAEQNTASRDEARESLSGGRVCIFETVSLQRKGFRIEMF